MSKCNRHKYEFVKNVTIANIKVSAKGTTAKVSFRAIYRCTVCGEQVKRAARREPKPTTGEQS